MPTMPFETFWNWLLRHPNCILRAGTQESVLYDDDDLHWHFAVEGSVFYVEVICGKRLLGEISVDSERVTYVESVGEEREGEHLFELISEDEQARFSLYFFVLAHGFEEGELRRHERAPCTEANRHHAGRQPGPSARIAGSRHGVDLPCTSLLDYLIFICRGSCSPCTIVNRPLHSRQVARNREQGNR